MNRRLLRWIQHQIVSLVIAFLIITLFQIAREEVPDDEAVRCAEYNYLHAGPTDPRKPVANNPKRATDIVNHGAQLDRDGHVASRAEVAQVLDAAESKGTQLKTKTTTVRIDKHPAVNIIKLDPVKLVGHGKSTTKRTKDVANNGLSDPSRQQPVSNGIKPSANRDKNPPAEEHSPTASNLSVARSQRERFNREHPQIDVDTSRPVVNPHPFRYLINCPDLCQADDRDRRPIFLLNYVHTAVGHFGRRKRIRRTWAREANYPDVRMKTVFFVGRDPMQPKWFEDALVYEAKKYGDIVQEDFIDTYRNLSYKGVAALKWIATYCNRTTYVLKTDDDVFINMFALLKHLHDIHAEHHRTRLIMCLVWWIAHVQREGQWGIPVDEYPDPLYPIYCAGMGWIVSVDVALAQYRVAPFVPFFWVDDAYISGFLPRALGGAVNHTEMTAAYCGAHEMAVYGHETEWYKYIFTHVHDEDLYLRTWNTLVRIAATRRIPSPNVIRPGVLAESYIPKNVLFPPKTSKGQ